MWSSRAIAKHSITPRSDHSPEPLSHRRRTGRAHGVRRYLATSMQAAPLRTQRRPEEAGDPLRALFGPTGRMSSLVHTAARPADRPCSRARRPSFIQRLWQRWRSRVHPHRAGGDCRHHGTRFAPYHFAMSRLKLKIEMAGKARFAFSPTLSASAAGILHQTVAHGENSRYLAR